MGEGRWSWRQDEGWAEQAVADLEKQGYAVAPSPLSAEEVERLREQFDIVAEREEREGTAWMSNGNHRVFNLLNRGEDFVALIDHPAVIRVIEEMLGPDALLSSITANVALPGNSPQALHADQQYVTEPWAVPMVANVVWMLDEFTERNGGTRMVPGSHVLGRRPLNDEIPSVPVEAPAGSVAFIDGRVWHGTGANDTSDERRRALFADYCAPYIRPKENVFRSLDPDVRVNLTPRQRRLLGYDVWYGMGVVDGFPLEWRETGQRSGPINVDSLFPA
jgi:ectoine hydroxylase-related dioxygenase (phytanoyl-CoA dioxygenase family)